jgi:hypothetical protein
LTVRRCSQAEDRGFSPKACNLAKEMEKGFLSKMLSRFDIASHAEAEGVNAPFVKVVQRLEAFTVPLLGTVDGFGF